MGNCVTVELQFNEIKAWGDFAYNVGTGAFCDSTAAKLLNAGQNKKACA
jgi:GH24 family phage-related lysozyme (muramidase)